MTRILSFIATASAFSIAMPATALDSLPAPVDPGAAIRTSLSPLNTDTDRRLEEPRSPPPGLSGDLDGATIGAVQVVGGAGIDRAQFAAAVAPFLGRKFGEGDTQELLGAVSTVARDHGFAFATSNIPSQIVTAGVLRVEVLEGLIDEVRLEGEQRRDVADLLSPLVGRIGRTREIDRLLMQATDLPGVTIGKARYIIENSRGILTVAVGYDRVRGWASFDNRGSEALGPVRAQMGIDVAALLSLDDRLTVQSVVTPADPGELTVLFARYAHLLPGASTELAVSGTYGRTHSGGRWKGYDPRGRSIGGTIGLTQTITRGRNDSLWASIDFSYLKIDQWWEAEHIQRDRVAALAMSLNGYTAFAGGRLRAGASATRALPILGATEPGDPLASREGAGSDYLVLRAWTNWTGRLVGPLSARLAITAQLADAPLLAIDQLTIGGPGFGRGYDFSERAGDQGALGSAELRSDLFDRGQGLLRGMQIYTFADAGVVHDRRSSFGTGDLYSAGAGARLRFANNLRLEVEAALPLNELRYDSGSRSPLFSAAIGAQF